MKLSRKVLTRWIFLGLVPMLLLALLVACGRSEKSDATGELRGTIEIDGSSTVFPITLAVAEEFEKVHRKVKVVVGISGTGGGFQRFVEGDTDISDASRAIKDSEILLAVENGIEYVELRVGIDGLSVMVHPDNDFVDCLTLEELKLIWEPGSLVDAWNDIRPEWPDRNVNLYGPDTDSGTFDYFTQAVMGEAQLSRPDYTASPDDNFLVQGIAGDRNSLGYFGYAYYIGNADKLRPVAVDSGEGCVLPTSETIEAGQYSPLSRPLIIYVNTETLERPEIRAFIEFYMENSTQLVREVGYIPMGEEVYQQNLAKIQ